MKTKICSKCKENRPLVDYYKSSAFISGIHSSCKYCCRIYNNQLRKRNHGIKHPHKCKENWALNVATKELLEKVLE